MKIKVPTAVAVIAACAVSIVSALAQFPGSATYSIETTQYRPTDIQLRRGETKLLRWRFLQDGAALSIPETATVTLNYKAPGATGGYYVATGAVYSATGGTVQVVWYSAMNPTNRVSDYDVTVATLTATLCRAFGRLNLDSQVAVGIATGNPGVVREIDWATVQNSNIGSAPFISTMSTGGVTRIDDSADILNSGDGTGIQTLTLTEARLASLAKADAALTNAAAFYPANNPSGYVGTAALASYVPTNDPRYLASLTNAAAFATAAQGARADVALTNLTDATHGQRGGSNLHSLATGSGAGFLSAVDYARIQATVTNGGPTLNGQSISNGAALDITIQNMIETNKATVTASATVGNEKFIDFIGNEDGGRAGVRFSADSIGDNKTISIEPYDFFGDGSVGFVKFVRRIPDPESIEIVAAIGWGGYWGNGYNLTNLNGASIQSGTITSNQIAAATDAAYRSGGGGGISSGDVTNILNAVALLPATVPYSTNVTLFATTNHEDLVLTGPTTINLAAGNTNNSYVGYCELWAGTNPVTWATSISNSASVYIRTTGVTPFMAIKPRNSFWRVIGL